VIKSRRIKYVGHVARTGKRRGAYRIAMGKPKARNELGRPSHVQQDNVKNNLEEM
jgi:hypothetical protein